MILLYILNFLSAVNSFLYTQTRNNFLTHFQRLAHSIIRFPRFYTLVPVSLVFIVSYPAIYTLYSTPNLISLSSIGNFKSISAINEFNSSTPIYHLNSLAPLTSGGSATSIMVKQLWLLPSFSANASYSQQPSSWRFNSAGALEKDFLAEAMDFSEQLLQGLDVHNYNIHDRNNGIVDISQPSSFVYSVLNFWNFSKLELQADASPLKTVQVALRKKASAAISTNPSGLLGGISKNNGLVVSAESLKISLFYSFDPTTQASPGAIWDKNLQQLRTSKQFPFLILKRDPEYRTYQEFYLKLANMSSPDKLLLSIANILIVTYLVVSLLNVHGVKSKFGLLLAFAVQMSLAILSSITVTFHIFNDLDLLQIPVQILSFVVVVVGIENMFRLISSISNMKDSIFAPAKFVRFVSESNIISTIIVAIGLIILLLLSPFVSESAKQFCVFASSALVVNHILHMTYFTAVLSVDVRRLELEDLLQNSSDYLLDTKGENNSLTKSYYRNGLKSKQLLSKTGSLFSPTFSARSSNNLSSIRHSLGNILLKPKLPFSTSITNSIIMLLVLAVVTIKWIGDGFTFNLFGLFALERLFSFRKRASDPDPILLILKSVDSKNSSIHENVAGSAYSTYISAIQNSVNADTHYPFSCFFSQKLLGITLSRLVSEFDYVLQNHNSIKADNSDFRVFVEEPSYAIKKTAFAQVDVSSGFSVSDYFKPDSSITYRFDVYYFLEFLVSLAFILAVSAIIIKYCLTTTSSNLSPESYGDELEPTSSDYDNTSKSFQSKDLVGGHALDIIKISSNKTSPFVISIGMDHRVLVWSPAAIPLPSPMSLPVDRQIWPITHTVLSMHGNLIAVFSRKGIVKVWSRLSMTWICSVNIAELKNSVPFESFFRKKTVLQTMMRRRQQRVNQLTGQVTSALPSAMAQSSQATHASQETEELKVLGNGASAAAASRVPRNLSRKSSISSIRSNSSRHRHQASTSNTAFETPPVNIFEGQVEADYELSLVLKDGKLYTVSLTDGAVVTTVLAKEELVTCKVLVSPRVNDRIVCGTKNGKIVVATVVNNKWRMRTLFIQEGRYNRGKGLMTPLAMKRTNMKMLNQAQPGKLSRQPSIGSMTNVVVPLRVPPEDFEHSTIATVSFVGMIVRTHGLTAELIDVQTGTLVKRFHIGQFKKGTFHVFHDHPTHCRFCGCASISSFSFAYTEIDTNTLIMHTFSNENRAKNNICLRVERDPRETRCLGFDSTTEHQHWLENVEVWEQTELNMLEGIKRKVSYEIDESNFDSSSPVSSYSRFQDATSQSANTIRSRKLPNKASKTCANLNNNGNTTPHIAESWEGFTMSASGQITYHEIPNGKNEGLLVKRLSTVARFGHKAIVVPFGNIMKVLYLGNEDLIMQNLDEDGNNNQKISGLSFVNKRRMRKNGWTSSNNFAEMPTIKAHERA